MYIAICQEWLVASSEQITDKNTGGKNTDRDSRIDGAVQSAKRDEASSGTVFRSCRRTKYETDRLCGKRHSFDSQSAFGALRHCQILDFDLDVRLRAKQYKSRRVQFL